jgi:hypothetical protein
MEEQKSKTDQMNSKSHEILWRSLHYYIEGLHQKPAQWKQVEKPA